MPFPSLGYDGVKDPYRRAYLWIIGTREYTDWRKMSDITESQNKMIDDAWDAAGLTEDEDKALFHSYLRSEDTTLRDIAIAKYRKAFEKQRS